MARSACSGSAYAAAPVGPLRWNRRSRREVGGVKETRSSGRGACRPRRFRYAFSRSGTKRGLLNLNVWTPAKERKRSAVMVWITAAGLLGRDIGAAAGRRALAHKVYRRVDELPAGSVWVPGAAGLAAESPQHTRDYGCWTRLQRSSGCSAISPLSARSEQRNDFWRVCGLFSVSAQMASPLAQGLFAHAIGESGAAFPGQRGEASGRWQMRRSWKRRRRRRRLGHEAE